MFRFLLLLTGLSLCFGARGQEAAAPTVASGKMVHLPQFTSRYVAARGVSIWLPAGYNPRKQYPVLYLQDGQNLFDAAVAYGGQEWQIDETMGRLIKEKKIPPTIVVGIWNTPLRWREYAPSKAIGVLPAEAQQALTQEMSGESLSDLYLRFVALELKPYVDSAYSTLRDPRNTFIGGSSMGALLSLYAVCEYPKVFGGAMCLSTHWPGSLKQNNGAIPGAINQYLAENLPSARDHKLYFDYGFKGLDSLYAPYQQMVNQTLVARGYKEGKAYVSKVYPGAGHNEQSWAKRFDIPVLFLFSDKPELIAAKDEPAPVAK